MNTLEQSLAQTKSADLAIHAPLVKHESVEEERNRYLGRMVSAVAHELNNRLTSVLGYADLLLLGANNGSQDPLVRKLQRITESLRHFTENLSGFSRLSERPPAICDPAVLIRQVVDLASCLSRHGGVEIRMEPMEDMPRLKLLESQFRFALFIVLDVMIRSLVEHGNGGASEIVLAAPDGVRLEIASRINGEPFDRGLEEPAYRHASEVLESQGIQAGWERGANGIWRFVLKLYASRPSK